MRGFDCRGKTKLFLLKLMEDLFDMEIEYLGQELHKEFQDIEKTIREKKEQHQKYDKDRLGPNLSSSHSSLLYSLALFHCGRLNASPLPLHPLDIRRPSRSTGLSSHSRNTWSS